MAFDEQAWATSTHEFRHALREFSDKVKSLQREIGKALRSPHDPDAAIAFLKSLKTLSEAEVPAFPRVDAWLQYWEARQRDSWLKFEGELRAELCKLQEEVRQETGENWLLSLDGSYPQFTIARLVTVDVSRFGSSVQRVASYVRKALFHIVRRRFDSPAEFLRCLYVAYRMALAVDEGAQQQSPSDQDLRRLHRLLPFAIQELLGGPTKRAATYPIEALGVDLGRCAAAQQWQVGHAKLELIQTKYTGSGVRLVHPDVPATTYGKARFVTTGGEEHDRR